MKLNDSKIVLILPFEKEEPQKLSENEKKFDEYVNDIFGKGTQVIRTQWEYLAYIRAEQAEQDYRAQMEYATEEGEKKGEKIGVKKGEKIGVKKGEKIGVKKGEKIGVKKGEKIGVKKGKKEGKHEKAVEIATKLKKSDLSIEKISEFTGLSIEEIKEL